MQIPSWASACLLLAREKAISCRACLISSGALPQFSRENAVNCQNEEKNGIFLLLSRAAMFDAEQLQVLNYRRASPADLASGE
jgi:hypothetical protein